MPKQRRTKTRGRVTPDLPAGSLVSATFHAVTPDVTSGDDAEQTAETAGSEWDCVLDTAAARAAVVWREPSPSEQQAVTTMAQEYVADFAFRLEPGLPPNIADGLFAILFDNNVSAYYNRDVAIAVSRFLAFANHGSIGTEQRLYYAEDAIVRLVRCWDYLWQSVREALDLNLLVSQGIKHDLLLGSTYDAHVVYDAAGRRRLRYESRPIDEVLAIVRRARPELRVQKIDRAAKSIRKEIRKKYQDTSWLNKLFAAAQNPLYLELTRLRNEFMHVAPSSSTIRYGPKNSPSVPSLGMTKRTSIAWGGPPLIDAAGLAQKLPAGMDLLRQAITIARRAVYLRDVPDRNDAIGRQFTVQRVRCVECNTKFLVPAELIGVFEEVGVDCVNCRTIFAIHSSATDQFNVRQYVYEKVLEAHLSRK
jgi:phage FluMu protein Com